jgi:hypothetical protein
MKTLHIMAHCNLLDYLDSEKNVFRSYQALTEIRGIHAEVIILYGWLRNFSAEDFQQLILPVFGGQEPKFFHSIDYNHTFPVRFREIKERTSPERLKIIGYAMELIPAERAL